MKGTKRLAALDAVSDTNDSALHGKRVVAGSAFDFHSSAPSQQQSMASPPLDMQRAESSRQHVRALNSQFASWVERQLKDHPDELWEDGVKDYLSHASNIMEKFSDVVNWLKANATKGENASATNSRTAERKLLPEIKTKEVKSAPEKTFTAASTASFPNPWSSGVFTNNQTPFMFGGNQTSAPSNRSTSNTTNNADDEDEPPQPSSPSVKKSEEKGITTVHEVKCKLYVKSSNPADEVAWKDKGTGQLSIKCKEGVSKGTKESKPTIVIRNDVGKLLLNALLYPGIKTNLQKNSVVAIFHTADDASGDGSAMARTFLIRTKTEDDRNKLASAIQEYAPAS